MTQQTMFIVETVPLVAPFIVLFKFYENLIFFLFKFLVVVLQIVAKVVPFRIEKLRSVCREVFFSAEVVSYCPHVITARSDSLLHL